MTSCIPVSLAASTREFAILLFPSPAKTIFTFQTQVAGDKGLGLPEAEVEQVGAVAAADLQNVAEAAGGDQAGLGALALGEGVDDRTLCLTGELFDSGVAESADDDTVQITAQNFGGVGDGLTASDLHFALVEIERIASELAYTDLKRDSGPC